MGKNGWMFYTPDNNIKIASGTYPLSGDLLKEIVDKQIIIRDKLKAQGIDYIFVIAPSKAGIYPEMITSGNYSVGKTVGDIFSDAMETAGINVINLREPLLTGKKEEQVYFKTDTHWNEVGAYFGYNYLLNRLTSFGIINSKPIEVEFVPSSRQCEFAAMMGNENFLPSEDYNASVITGAKANSIYSDETFDRIMQINQYYNINTPVYMFANSFKDQSNVLLFGDSMFGMWNMPEMLGESFSQYTYVWSQDITQEYIDAVHPDVVIYEIAERYLNILDTKSPVFSINILNNPQAVILDVDSSQLNIGSTSKLNVTVKNSGNEQWSSDQNIRLGYFIDGYDSGYRFDIPKGVVINPSEEYTFSIDAFKVPDAASGYIEFTMLQEGITYFGNRFVVDVF
nr:hypothetical protein [Fusibacter paucivorans]